MRSLETALDRDFIAHTYGYESSEEEDDDSPFSHLDHINQSVPPPVLIFPPVPPQTPISRDSQQSDELLKPKPLALDPLLAALEAASRVNVRSACAVCKIDGVNFPKCPKCDETFCSRRCRLNELGKGSKCIGCIEKEKSSRQMI